MPRRSTLSDQDRPTAHEIPWTSCKRHHPGRMPERKYPNHQDRCLSLIRLFLSFGANRMSGQKPSVITPKVQARVLEATRCKPKDGSTHWSCRKLAR